jgi:hypothetical protein
MLIPKVCKLDQIWSSSDSAELQAKSLQENFFEDRPLHESLLILKGHELKIRNIISETNGYSIISAYPATGILYIINKFMTGQLRMRGEREGSYPTNYLTMIDRIFGPEDNTIEVCSRTVKGRNRGGSCFTVDINPECNADLIVDGQDLAAISDNSFSRWRCDPPYNKITAKKMYGTDLPKLGKLLSEGARVVKPGSLMFLLCSQNYQPCPDVVKRIGYLYISVVPNNETRILNIYIKT